LESFKGTPSRGKLYGWPSEWQGRNYNIGNSMCSDGKDFPVSDVKIAINLDHLLRRANLDQVDLFDIITVKAGPNLKIEEEQINWNNPDIKTWPSLPPLKLTISTLQSGLFSFSIHCIIYQGMIYMYAVAGQWSPYYHIVASVR
jgi:hypothetical protein